MSTENYLQKLSITQYKILKMLVAEKRETGTTENDQLILGLEISLGFRKKPTKFGVRTRAKNYEHYLSDVKTRPLK